MLAGEFHHLDFCKSQLNEGHYLDYGYGSGASEENTNFYRGSDRDRWRARRLRCVRATRGNEGGHAAPAGDGAEGRLLRYSKESSRLRFRVGATAIHGAAGLGEVRLSAYLLSLRRDTEESGFRT